MKQTVFVRSFVRILPLVTVLAALCGNPCAATPVYIGQFTQTITSSNVAGVKAGAVYKGSYFYESDSIDGVFYDNVMFPEPSTLHGFIFLPFAKYPDSPLGPQDVGYGPHWHDLESTPLTGMLSVENGQVAGFSWAFDFGGFYMSAGYSPSGNGDFFALSFYDRSPQVPLKVTGTIAFSDPALRVPDSGTSALMTAFGLLGLALVHRRTRHARALPVPVIH